ncbi:MAG: cytochrome P450 [Gammaproteobacteria bacterium]
MPSPNHPHVTQCTFHRIGESFDPFDADYLNDPYSFFAQARAHAPIAYSPRLDRWLVTRYEDIVAILKDPQRFSSRNMVTPLYPMIPEAKAILESGLRITPTLVDCDPPKHTHMRGFVNRAFSPRRMATLEPQIRDLVQQLINAFAGNQPVDLIQEFAFPLPALTIFTMIGVPDCDKDLVKSWCDDRLQLFFGILPPEGQVHCAHNIAACWRYCEQLVEQRLQEPQDDFTSDLLKVRRGNEELLSLQEITSIIYGLSLAGHETTTSLIGNCLKHLLSDLAIWRAVSEDPSLIPNIVEETLRHDTSLICWRRITTEPVEVGGVSLPANTKLLLLLGSANHDDAQFANAEVFDIHRENARSHLSFGKGIHYCLGASLARLQTQITIQVMTTRFPGMRLVPDQTLEYSPNLSFRGPKQLLAEWG